MYLSAFLILPVVKNRDMKHLSSDVKSGLPKSAASAFVVHAGSCGWKHVFCVMWSKESWFSFREYQYEGCQAVEINVTPAGMHALN